MKKEKSGRRRAERRANRRTESGVPGAAKGKKQAVGSRSLPARAFGTQTARVGRKAHLSQGYGGQASSIGMTTKRRGAEQRAGVTPALQGWRKARGRQ